ncbi:MAG: division/cell wall cluster transcriptional repressor MraZ [Methylococcales bacterium]|nr:division/cell wall cluster transcriptional repressor MraZ [Methylococcales bacterium]MBT7446102.1 division/cell wall cluster transcriptional repressor MraZ [Methylococcales bacterium]
MFRGVSSLNLDTKGRIGVPKKYRQEIDDASSGQMIVTIDPNEKCLLLYTLPEWEIIERKLSKLSSMKKQTRRLQRLLIGHATDVDMDRQGRVLLPPPLRNFAGMDKPVVMVGMGNKFELWDETHWNEKRDIWIEEDGSDEDEPDEEVLSLSI